MPQNEKTEPSSMSLLVEILNNFDERDKKLALLIATLLEHQKDELLTEVRRLLSNQPARGQTERFALPTTWQSWFELLKRVRPSREITDSYRDLLDEAYDRQA